MFSLKPSLITKNISLHLLGVASGLLMSVPAQAATFNFFHDHGTSHKVTDAFVQAGDIWSSILLDDVDINIFVKYEEFDSDRILGGARPDMVEVSYNQYLQGIFWDISSVDDLQAFKSLQFDPDDRGIAEILQQLGLADLSELTLDQVLAMDREAIAFSTESFGMLRSDTSGTILDNNGKTNNSTIWLTSANAKALGLMSGRDDNFAIDSEIAINSNILSNPDLWDFSRVYNHNAKINKNKIDFLAVALHEIGHSLGFVSGIDTADMLYIQAEQGEIGPIEETELTYVSPLDLFRHSESSRNAGVFDWTSGTGKYFSLDGGVTNLGNFAGGISDNGDGYQTSHWEKQDQPLGIMNPTLEKGQVINISDLDRLLLDTTGWDLNLATLSTVNHQNQAKKSQRGTDSLMGLPFGWWYRRTIVTNRWRWWMNVDLQADITANNVLDNRASVPEPSSAIALLSFGVIGGSLLRKQKS